MITRREAQQPVIDNLGRPLTEDIAMQIQCVYGNHLVVEIADWLRRNGHNELSGRVINTFIDGLG